MGPTAMFTNGDQARGQARGACLYGRGGPSVAALLRGDAANGSRAEVISWSGAAASRSTRRSRQAAVDQQPSLAEDAEQSVAILQDGDVGQRIAIDDQEVGRLAAGDGAGLVTDSQRLGG